MNNMFEKGPMNRAVAAMFHDVNSGVAALEMYNSRLEKICAQLMADESTKELGATIWDSVWRSKQEREGIIKAMDGFYVEFQQDFPDRLATPQEKA